MQSIPQLSDRYPLKEWEELIGCADVQIALGCNDNMTADYLSKKCGFITIKVENNQLPMQPLFSPIYNTTRPYSQTKSNTQRALLLPDEIQHMDNRECLVMLRGQKPLKLYKITPEELPDFAKLRETRVADHTPAWRAETPPPQKTEPPTEPAKKPEPKPQPTPPPAAENGPPPETEREPQAGQQSPTQGPSQPETAKRPGQDWLPRADYSYAGLTEKLPYGALEPIDEDEITPGGIQDEQLGGE